MRDKLPKGRTNSIASRRTNSNSGAGGAVNQEIETAERLNDRLVQAGTVEVQVHSRTRGQTERVGVRFSQVPGTAEVISSSGMNYTVNYEDGTCDCMHYIQRQERCRHIDAANIAAGQVIEGNGNQEFNINTAVAQRISQDAIEEAHRNQIFAELEDDNFFYLDNEDEFNEKLRNGIEVPYDYENALNGSNITFGIELEFVGGNADAIARELYDLGICGYDHRVGYHSPGINGKWKLERDGTVSSGGSGGELVSPVLRDTPETWRNIEKICEVAKRHGATIDQRCGGHVHIGMEPLDTARQRWRRFFKVISGYEECIYRASGGDEGRIRRGHIDYASTFADRANYGSTTYISMDNENDVIDLARRVSNNNRYYGINLTNITNSSKPDTVEFRYFNGSLNAKQIQANVKLASGIIMASEKARTKDVESISLNVTEAFKRRGNLLNNHNVTEERSNKKIAEFMDIIFTRKKDKDALISVFSKNRWR